MSSDYSFSWYTSYHTNHPNGFPYSLMLAPCWFWYIFWFQGLFWLVAWLQKESHFYEETFLLVFKNYWCYSCSFFFFVYFACQNWYANSPLSQSIMLQCWSLCCNGVACLLCWSPVLVHLQKAPVPYNNYSNWDCAIYNGDMWGTIVITMLDDISASVLPNVLERSKVVLACNKLLSSW